MNAERLYSKMEQENLDYLVLSRIDNVDYLTGMTHPSTFGAFSDNSEQMPFAYAVVSLADKKVTLVASKMMKFAVPADIIADETVWFDQYSYMIDYNGAKEAMNAIEGTLPANCAGKRVGVELDVMPAALYRMLMGKQFELVDAQDILIYARQVKTAREIEKIKYACYLEDIAQERLIRFAKEFNGETDLEMWHAIMFEMNKAAGKVLDLSGELATGAAAGSTNYPSGPIGRQVKEGEMGRMDISIRPHGYWCDCTNTVVFGNKINDRQKFLFDMVEEAYIAAEEIMKPGVDMYDVHKLCLDIYGKYGYTADYYTGHQIGTGANDRPRILTYTHCPLEAGMVVCLEPQMYMPGDDPLGVRLEHVVLITENGPEDLNKFTWGHKI